MSDLMDMQRMAIVMKCFDKLPLHLREWVSNLKFSLHDDHILRGTAEVERCKVFIESGGIHHESRGNGQN
jgi:hypothetical protein